MNKQENKHCKKVDVANLVNEDIKEELFFFRNNSDFNEDDIIWQQMTCENFSKFLGSNALCFKSLSQYGEKDERKLGFYKLNYVNNVRDENKKQLIMERNACFERIAYISCWFHLNHLTELAFNEYAKNEGVAIGVRIKDLIDTLENSDKLATYEEIYYGKVAYLNSSYKLVTSCEEAIAPLYLKNTSKLSDNEFRLIYVKDSLWRSTAIGMQLPDIVDKFSFINIGSASKIIKYIAIKEDNENFNNAIYRYNLNIHESTKKIDGFKVYEIDNN